MYRSNHGCGIYKNLYKLSSPFRGTIEATTEQSQPVDTIIVHRDWDWGTIENDIAILTFKENFKMDDNVGIACLPNPLEEAPEKATCYITGRKTFILNSIVC